MSAARLPLLLLCGVLALNAHTVRAQNVDPLPSEPAAFATAPPPESAIRAPRNLTIGVLSDASPFSAAERYGVRGGFDIEIAYALCARMDVRCSLEPLSRGAMPDALKSGRIDAAIASDGHSDRIGDVADLSAPYVNLAARFVVPRAASNDLEAQDERPYGALIDTDYAQYLTKTYPSGSAVMLFDRAPEMWIDLALGRLSGVLATAVTARTEFLNTDLGGEFLLSASALTDPSARARTAAVAVRHNDDELMRAINAAITQYLSTEDYTEVLARHLGDGLAERPADEAPAMDAPRATPTEG